MPNPLNTRVRGIRQTLPTGTLLGRLSSGSGAPEVIPVASLAQTLANQPALKPSGATANIQTLLDGISTTQGVILYYNGTSWVALPPGTAGEALTTEGANANPIWVSPANIQTLLDSISTTQGTILYYNGTSWVALPPGPSGAVLTSQGSGANPIWVSPVSLANACMYLNAPISWTATGSITLIPLNTINYDTTSISSTTNHGMTIKTAGVYLAYGTVYGTGFAAAGGATPYIGVDRGGTQYYNNIEGTASVASGGAFDSPGSIILNLEVNDLVQLMLYTTQNCTVQGATGVDSVWTELVLVGPLGT